MALSSAGVRGDLAAGELDGLRGRRLYLPEPGVSGSTSPITDIMLLASSRRLRLRVAGVALLSEPVQHTINTW